MQQRLNRTPLELLARGCLAVAAAGLFSATGLSADESGGTASLSEILPGKPWPERRKEVERRWLELLGDFPTEIAELRPEIKEVAKEDGITRYHVSFQYEESDRVTV